MPKVTVILTSYNHAKYIRETIDSILNQTFKDFELIIWDDSSTDDSWEIIQSYKDKRIKTFRNEESKRAIYGINKTIKEISKGKYIAIHHSDDIWESTKLEKQVKFLDENRDYGAVFTNVQPIDGEGHFFNNSNHFYYSIFNQSNKTKHEWLNFFFYRGNALCHPSILIKKECYNNCGSYRYGLAQIGDFDMWIRLCMKYEIYILPEKLTKFRIRNNEANSSGNTPINRIRTQTEYFYLLENFLNLNLEDFIKVFGLPTIPKIKNLDLYKKCAFAKVCLQEESLKICKLFGLNLMYQLLNHNESAEILKKQFNFNYKDLITLSGKYDVFNIEPLQNNFIELYINTEVNYYKNTVRYNISNHNESQVFIFDLSEYENIKSLRLDPLNDSCIVKIEKIILIKTDKEQIDVTSLIKTNSLKEYGQVLFFDNNDPRIELEEQINFSKSKTLIIEIKYYQQEKEAYKTCLEIVKKDYKEFLVEKLLNKKINKLVFFGASSALEKTWDTLMYNNIIPDFICDNDPAKQGKYFKGYPILSENNIFNQNTRFYVLITSSYALEIKKQLEKYSNILEIVTFKDILNIPLVIYKNPPKAIFLHIQKTAGTTIIHLAQQIYGNNEIISHGDYLEYTCYSELKNKLFISGHFGYSYFSKICKDRFSFTFLREPRERIISFYYFCLSRDSEKHAKEKSLYELVQSVDLYGFLSLVKTDLRVKNWIFNHQVRQFAIGLGAEGNEKYNDFKEEELLEKAILNLSSFSYVGFTETFKEDRDYILLNLGMIPPKDNKIVNKSPNKKYIEDLPEKTLSLLDELVYYDDILYQYMVEIKNKETLFSNKYITQEKRNIIENLKNKFKNNNDKGE